MLMGYGDFSSSASAPWLLLEKTEFVAAAVFIKGRFLRSVYGTNSTHRLLLVETSRQLSGES